MLLNETRVRSVLEGTEREDDLKVCSNNNSVVLCAGLNFHGEAAGAGSGLFLDRVERDVELKIWGERPI